MNSQYIPGSAENFNQQTHARLLKDAAEARRLKGTGTGRLFKRQEKAELAPGLRANAPQPTVLAPALSAVLTAAFALQVALLLAI